MPSPDSLQVDKTATANSIETGGAIVLLVIYHETDALVRPLGPGQSITVGRSPQAGVTVSDSSVSREHARFSFSDGVVTVEDMGSRNGVMLNGKLVQRAILKPEEQVTLGKVRVWFHENAGGSGRTAPAGGILERYEDLRARAELELERARDEKFHLSVVVIRSTDPKGEPVNRSWLRIRARLGPSDAVTAYSPDAILVTLAAKSTADSRSRAKSLLTAGEMLVCGIAESPVCGQSFEALVAEAHAASLRASSKQRLVVAPGPAPLVATPARRVIAMSPAFVGLLGEVDRLAVVDLPIVVTGESGSGKEVVAERLHFMGPRAKGPLCAVNCAAIPGELLESILFGHVRGAFTGADRDTQGVFLQADGGTLFLDEVAELSPTAQASLLRVLETQLVRPVGSTKDIRVDVRVVSATNADLEAMVAQGKFRSDLLFRIGAVTLHVPALRDRPEDVEALADLFIEQACERWRRPRPRITAALRMALRAYAWPGNARELRNVVERAIVISGAGELDVEHLPDRVRAGAGARDAGDSVGSMGASPPVSAGPESENTVSNRSRMAAYEIELIRAALRDSAGNRAKAAARIGMPLRTFMRKLKKHGLA